MAVSLQDRTSEFHTLTTSASKRLARAGGPSSAHQRLLQATPPPPSSASSSSSAKHARRGEFARRAAAIGKSITDTMGKLERLAQRIPSTQTLPFPTPPFPTPHSPPPFPGPKRLMWQTVAKRKALFDDKPVEIAELTYVIKQDLSAINSNISALQAFARTQQQQQAASSSSSSPAAAASPAATEHSRNVVVMLQGKLADVSVGFKEVLEVRTRNIQASRARTEQFVSGVRPASPAAASALNPASHSPLYHTPSATPQPPSHPHPHPHHHQHSPNGDLLSLDVPPPASSAQQLALLEEGGGQGTYIQARGEAIEAIERTITELGGIFGQLAQMVGEQRDMIQRIDAETEDVVANVEGGQRELFKYFARVSSNRWLVIKMFGVLMIFFLLWVLVS